MKLVKNFGVCPRQAIPISPNGCSISIVYLEQTSQTLVLEMAFLVFCVGEGEVILSVAFYNLSARCH